MATVRSAEVSGELDKRLQRIERSFGPRLDNELAGSGESLDSVIDYYDRSDLGYRWLHSSAGAIHLALNPDGKFDRDGYWGQATH